uniref:Uncharacterized protein n=1 Tax=Erythrocytic necrosis virus TaxID=1543320 RepID=A0A4D6QJ97_9VIRU|nr:hypothetical protein [Erythrocytic necrosis virus]
MYDKFSNLVKAFMNIDLFDDATKIEILHTMFYEPLMRDDSIPVIIGLACRFRAEKKTNLLEILCDKVGLKLVETSIYNQETAHVFQKNYKNIAINLLQDYKPLTKKKHKIPKHLVDRFQNIMYQDISIRKILNIVYQILKHNNALDLLISELEENVDTCATGFITRVLNCIFPFTSYKIDSFEYEREKLFNKFNTFILSKEDSLDFIKILTEHINTDPAYDTIEPNVLLTVLEQYTGKPWGVVNNVFFPSLTF